MCNPKTKTDHFLINFPESQACKKVEEKSQELTNIVKHKEVCRLRREEKETKELIAWLLPLCLLLFTWVAGITFTLVCICYRLKKRNLK